MCSCTSCKATDALANKGFAAWPRGNPAGRKAAQEYAAHVRHGLSGIASSWEFVPDAPPRFPAWCRGTPVSRDRLAVAYPVKWETAAEYIADFERRNSLKKASPDRSEPARPAQACKPAQHFPELDRQREAGLEYRMPKKRPMPAVSRGRPQIPGRRVIVKLEDWQIAKARELGGGGKQAIAAGIRKLFRQ